MNNGYENSRTDATRGILEDVDDNEWESDDGKLLVDVVSQAPQRGRPSVEH